MSLLPKYITEYRLILPNAVFKTALRLLEPFKRGYRYANLNLPIKS